MKGLIEMFGGDRLAGVQRRHGNALKAFENALTALNDVTVELDGHVTEAQNTIAKKMDEISAEKNAITLALNQKERAVRQIVKLKEILHA